MSVIAAWKMEGLYKADANLVAQEISDLGDAFNCQQIVEKARNKDTELHKCFERTNSNYIYRLLHR